jgi:hypothetical protein
MAVLAKDIVRIGREKLIRLWVNIQADPTKGAQWYEMGHFLAGFDYKLQRVQETDGLGRIRASAGYKSAGTFEAAQNATVDFQNYIFLMNGVRGVAMLYGNQQFPDQGKLLIHNWFPSTTGSYLDYRISIVCDPAYNSMLKGSGTIAGWVAGYQHYLVKDVTFASGVIKFTVLESLFANAAIAQPTPIGV